MIKTMIGTMIQKMAGCIILVSILFPILVYGRLPMMIKTKIGTMIQKTARCIILVSILIPILVDERLRR